MIAVMIVAVVAVGGDDRRTPSSNPSIEAPPTVDQLCAEIRELGAANGLIGPGSPDDATELNRLAAAIEQITTLTIDEDATELAARIRLLANAVDDEQGGAAINTARGIGDDVERLFDDQQTCSNP